MSFWFLASHIALWAMFLAQAVITLLVLRQIGILNLRVLHGGVVRPGPEAGEPAPSLLLPDIDNPSLELHMPPPDGKGVLLIFVSHDCPICEAIAPEIARLERATRDAIAWHVLGGGDTAACRNFRQSHGLGEIPFNLAPESVWSAYGIRGVPYAVLADHAGIVRARSPIGSSDLLEGILRVAQPTVVNP